MKVLWFGGPSQSTISISAILEVPPEVHREFFLSLLRAQFGTGDDGPKNFPIV